MKTNSFAEQSAAAAVKAVFVFAKTLVVLVALVSGALVVSQTSVAPVSSRLLASYALEYAVKTFKPYRHLFPEPYLIDLEQK